MNARQARENLPLYVDGELDPQVAADLEEQLAESAQLRDELERWRSLKQCAHRVFTAPSVPFTLGDDIREQLSRTRLVAGRRPLRWYGSITAIAAAIVLMFAWAWTRSSPEPDLVVAAERFAEIYRKCAVEKNHDPEGFGKLGLAAAQTKLSQRKAYAVLLPDLRDRGFQLDGVCECFKVTGVDVVHAHYRKAGAEPVFVSVFSVGRKLRLKGGRCGAPAQEEGQQHEYEYARARDVQVCKWDETASSYAFCGAMDADQLRELADGVTVAALQPAHVLLAWSE
jgi:anti-sigma factor RsiW